MPVKFDAMMRELFTKKERAEIRRAAIVRVTMTPVRIRNALSSIDWKRVRAMTDDEIERNALQDPDSIVSLPADLSGVRGRHLKPKKKKAP